MTKNRLTLLLIKKGVTEDQVLESGLNKIQLEDDYHLYYKQMLIKNPKWIDTFLLGNEESKNIFKTQCVSAILTVVLKKIFSLSSTRLVSFSYHVHNPFIFSLRLVGIRKCILGLYHQYKSKRITNFKF